jgi:hypothetical protein
MRDARDITFKIARIIRKTRLRFEEVTASPSAAGEYCCTCHWQDGGRLRGIGVAESDHAEPPKRESYDEDAIAALARFDARTATIARTADYPFIELLVAVNKKLVQRTLGEHAALLFTRLDLIEVPATGCPLTLTFERDIGMRHFASSVRVAERTVGLLYFSRRVP